MSRVLARSMFKKKAPKRSAKGVGITSMLEDDVAGYAEGGEVTDDRTERERLARQLLERNRDEGEMYQRFAEQERPQMYRPAATMGMVQPQPNPQQVQAMQMQQMAQMGMLPRFQEGGEVQAPSAWSRLRQGIGSAIGLRGRSGQPMFARGTEPEIYGSPIGSNMGSPAMDNPEFRYREPAMPIKDMPYTDPMGGYTGGMEPVPPTSDQGLGFSVPAPVRAAFGVPVFQGEEEKPYKPSADMGSPAGDTGGIMGGRMKALPKLPPRDRTGGGGGEEKKTDISDIKAERQAKAEAARQENIWLALMQAGLAIAGGKSSNAITNIGQGGQAGLASFMALEQQRRRDEDAAMRRDLAEREYGLQVRRQQMQEPYIQAQTEYLRMRPAIAAAQLQARQQGILAKAQMDAVRDIDAIEAKNPLAYSTNGKPDQMKKDIAIQRRTQQIAAQYAAIYGGGGGPMDRLGLGLGGGSADEE